MSSKICNWYNSSLFFFDDAQKVRLQYVLVFLMLLLCLWSKNSTQMFADMTNVAIYHNHWNMTKNLGFSTFHLLQDSFPGLCGQLVFNIHLFTFSSPLYSHPILSFLHYTNNEVFHQGFLSKCDQFRKKLQIYGHIYWKNKSS